MKLSKIGQLNVSNWDNINRLNYKKQFLKDRDSNYSYKCVPYNTF